MLPSPNETSLRLVVIGIPENRRVTHFVDAAVAAGLRRPRVIGWREIISGDYGFEPDEVIRIDSPGEDSTVDRYLRGSGESTRVEGTGRWYRRFTAEVREIADRAQRAGARLLADADEIAVMFDKYRCHRRLQAAGVRVPRALDSSPRDYSELEQFAQSAGMSRVFVKLKHGSSASGVIALQWGPRGQVKAVTSVEVDSDGGLHNSLRVRTYRSSADIAPIIDRLAPDGLHIEQWIPKASLGLRVADIRMVVVGGVATHAVVRTSTTPLTNLHLGGARGVLQEAMTVAGPEKWSQLLTTSERAGACFPSACSVGVDVLPGVGWRTFTVGEVNAFGDLLPGLTGLPGSRADGLDTYQAQVASILEAANMECAR